MHVKAIVRALIGIIFTPRTSIQRVAKEGSISVAIGMLIMIGIIDTTQDPFLYPFSERALFSPKLDMLAKVFLYLFSGVVFCGALHLGALLFKGKGHYKNLFVAMNYINVVIFVLGSILSLLLDDVQGPLNFLNLLLGLVMMSWSLSLWTLAVRSVHRFSTGRSIGSICVMIIILILILFVFRQFLTPRILEIFR